MIVVAGSLTQTTPHMVDPFFAPVERLNVKGLPRLHFHALFKIDTRKTTLSYMYTRIGLSYELKDFGKYYWVCAAYTCISIAPPWCTGGTGSRVGRRRKKL
jgi:hypothetical protein